VVGKLTLQQLGYFVLEIEGRYLAFSADKQCVSGEHRTEPEAWEAAGRYQTMIQER
jgi:hypothetical protein